MLAGQVLSVNVGRPRHVTWNGKAAVTAIWKMPVTDRRNVSLTNIDGDRQADLRVHGGLDKAVYVYSAADLAWWEEALGRPLKPGTFGENLTVTTSGDLGGSLIGDRWRIGSAEFEVTQPRLPCYKLGIRMGDAKFVRRFAKARRFGVYLRVLRPGEIGRGDAITVAYHPAHDVTVDMIGRAYLEDHSLATHILMAPSLPLDWRTWALKQWAIHG
ncbi:MAG: MOSC domain-containing protein [Chloroflexi bacterium]|nr:MAG: MOSC domain-containing protein [Chloroflexota bacterium]